MKDNKIPLLAVVGPTASGKTRMGVELCKAFDGEVISADSMQIYSEMPIATAVPSLDERQGVPHHLMEILKPVDTFSVADYVNLAHKTISEIYRRGKLPVLVGGTGLYVNSLIDNIQFLPEPVDLKLRERLQKELEQMGEEHMLEKLRAVDPKSAMRLHKNNRRRVIRALEIYELTGKTIQEIEMASRSMPSPYNVCMIGLTFSDRELLYDRIRRRVDIMLENGLLEEARSTLENSCGGGAQAIGHKELHKYFKGELELAEAVQLLKSETCRYAKRQLTWFRRDERINWIECDRVDDITRAALEIMKEAKFDDRLTQSN